MIICWITFLRFKRKYLVEDGISAISRLQCEFQQLFPGRNVSDVGSNPHPRNSLWTRHIAEVAAENSSIRHQCGYLMATQEYQRQSYLSIEGDPLTWWKTKLDYDYLKDFIPFVRKYLAIPATSCPSESLFSTAGDLISESRTRLDSDNIDMLLFLNRNG